MFIAYRFLMTLLCPMAWIIGKRRLKKGKEKKEAFPQRFGIITTPRPKGSLFWFHGASLGEAQCALNFIKRLQEEEGKNSCAHSFQRHPFQERSHFLLTVQTRAALEGLGARLPEGVILQMVPYDHPPFIKRFLKHWSPESLTVIEAEFWPGLWSLAHAWGVKICVLNFHMSAKSFRLWSSPLARLIFKKAYQWADLITTSCQSSQTYFKQLSAQPIVYTPSLKYQVEVQQEPRETFFKIDHPFLLVTCLHEKEEDLFLQIFGRLLDKMPNLKIVCAPRQADRFAPLLAKLEKLGPVARCSQKQVLEPHEKILLIDTFGHLNVFYREASFAVLGGSFVEGLKGHSLIEPAFCRCAVIHGRYMTHQSQIVIDFLENGSVVCEAKNLFDVLLKRLQEPVNNKVLGEKAFDIACEKRDLLNKALNNITSFWMTEKGF